MADPIDPNAPPDTSTPAPGVSNGPSFPMQGDDPTQASRGGRFLSILRNLAPAIQAMGSMPQMGVTPYKVSPLSGALQAVAGGGQVYAQARQNIIARNQQQRMLSLMNSPAAKSYMDKIRSGNFNFAPGELYIGQLLGMPDPSQVLGTDELRTVALTKGDVIPGATVKQKAAEAGGTGAGMSQIGMLSGQAPPAGTPPTPAELQGQGRYLMGASRQTAADASMIKAKNDEAKLHSDIGLSDARAAALKADSESRTKDAESRRIAAQAKADYEGREDTFAKAMNARISEAYPKGDAPQELRRAVSFMQMRGFYQLVDKGDPSAKNAVATMEKYLPMTKDEKGQGGWGSIMDNFLKPALTYLKSSLIGSNAAAPAPSPADNHARLEALASKAQAGTASNDELREMSELIQDLEDAQEGKPSGP